MELVGVYIGLHKDRPSRANTNSIFRQGAPLKGFTVNSPVKVYADIHMVSVSTTGSEQPVSGAGIPGLTHHIPGPRKTMVTIHITFPNNYEFTTFMTYMLNQMCHLSTPQFEGYGVPIDAYAVSEMYNDMLTLEVEMDMAEITLKLESIAIEL